MQIELYSTAVWPVCEGNLQIRVRARGGQKDGDVRWRHGKSPKQPARRQLGWPIMHLFSLVDAPAGLRKQGHLCQILFLVALQARAALCLAAPASECLDSFLITMLWNRRNGITAAAILVALATILLLSPYYRTAVNVRALRPANKVAKTHHDATTPITTELVQYFADYPPQPPYKEHFGELGRRCRVLRDWLVEADASNNHAVKFALLNAVEETAISQFPFLAKAPRKPESRTPIADLRSSIKAGSSGIVIPCGEKTARFAAHLIVSLRNVLGSKLPIQLVYAGEEDLSAETRTKLSDLKLKSGPAPEFLDITTVFDDSTLDLGNGGWAIKPFAILASRFERVILLDADAVFLQRPEVLFRHGAFVKTGTLLFHDRLLWQHRFVDRHEWWKSQVRRPSAALNASLVWTEDYAEEGDSGVVVVDKSRLDVLVGLLHICWQNSLAVREEVTYKLTYGDKESWWLGFELAGSHYQFEKHYGSIVGWEEPDSEDRKKVCSFVIAHVDEKDRLLWYNGSLLKNKQRVTNGTDAYKVPEKWMIDATWQKGATKEDMSCMVGGDIHDLTNLEMGLLAKSIDQAKAIDSMFGIV
ncbi:hypothetical protein ANO11243_044090 [Dothideomycetidae sp. 11243]|nr:hypothetical protein ANO11243_044090 [fungal sp. No.11243]